MPTSVGFIGLGRMGPNMVRRLVRDGHEIVGYNRTPDKTAPLVAAGGRTDEWRVGVELPPIVAKLDRAAGLDHREITGRSLWSG